MWAGDVGVAPAQRPPFGARRPLGEAAPSPIPLPLSTRASHSGYVTRRFGRRATMAAAGVMFCVGAVLTAGAVHVAMLVVGRICLGLGVGFANQARERRKGRQGQEWGWGQEHQRPG